MSYFCDTSTNRNIYPWFNQKYGKFDPVFKGN